MGYKKTVAHDPTLPRTVTDRTLGPVTCSPGGKLTDVIPKHTATPWLVERDPMLNFRAESLENYACVVGEVCDELFLIEETAVAFVELIGKIPVKQSNERSDTSSMQVVDELYIILQAFLIDGVVSATEWNNAGPRTKP